MDGGACPRLPEHVCMEVRVLGYLSMCGSEMYPLPGQACVVYPFT